MMGWNYRVMRHEDPAGILYDIHEVFYDREGSVERWTKEGASPGAESRDDILLVLAKMADAIGQPVLSADDGKEIEPGKVMTENLVAALGRIKDLFDDDTGALASQDGDHG